MKKAFRVWKNYVVQGYTDVEAENEDEAITKAEDKEVILFDNDQSEYDWEFCRVKELK